MKIFGLVLILMFGASVAGAQSTKEGTIVGTIIDKSAKAPAVGATAVVTSPSLIGEKVALTDEKGVFTILVPAGTYALTIYYNDAKFERKNLVVKAGAKLPVKTEIDAPPQHTLDIKGTPVEWKVTGDDFSFEQHADESVTVQRKGKSAVKVVIDDAKNQIFADGKLVASFSKSKADLPAYTIKAGGKVIAKFDKGVVTLTSKTKQAIKFDSEGNLLNAASKMKVSPEDVGGDRNMMFTLVAVLRDKL